MTTKYFPSYLYFTSTAPVSDFGVFLLRIKKKTRVLSIFLRKNNNNNYIYIYIYIYMYTHTHTYIYGTIILSQPVGHFFTFWMVAQNGKHISFFRSLLYHSFLLLFTLSSSYLRSYCQTKDHKYLLLYFLLRFIILMGWRSFSRLFL